MTDWSFGPCSSWWVFRQVVAGPHRTVVECGAGLSTVLIALAAQHGTAQGSAFAFYSLEHDRGWLQQTAAVLRQLGLEDFVHLVHAPIINHQTALGEVQSYSVAQLPADIDFLLIDGPPAHVGRLGVIPTLLPHLAKKALVLLDDAARDGERDCRTEWTRRGWLRFHGFYPRDHGLAVFTGGPALPAGTTGLAQADPPAISSLERDAPPNVKRAP
jgi:hypothetical protein